MKWTPHKIIGTVSVRRKPGRKLGIHLSVFKYLLGKSEVLIPIYKSLSSYKRLQTILNEYGLYIQRVISVSDIREIYAMRIYGCYRQA